VLSRVAGRSPRTCVQRLITAIVPQALQSTVEPLGGTTLRPTSDDSPLVAGPDRICLSPATGVGVSRSNQTLKPCGGGPVPPAAPVLSRGMSGCFAMLAALACLLESGGGSVRLTGSGRRAARGTPACQRANGSASGQPWSSFGVLLLAVRLLLGAAPRPVRALWPGAFPGARAAIKRWCSNVGAPLLARLGYQGWGPSTAAFAHRGRHVLPLPLPWSTRPLSIGGRDRGPSAYGPAVATRPGPELPPTARRYPRALALLAREQETASPRRPVFELRLVTPRFRRRSPDGSPPADDGPQ